MTNIKQFVGIVSVFLMAMIGICGTVGADGFDQFVGLGDSTIDTGYFRYNPSGYAPLDNALPAAIANGATGGWVGNGVMAMTTLGERFGVSAGSVGNGRGGTNYANGASYTDAAGPMPGSVAATQQIRNYLASVGGVANPRALYVVSSGNNDLLRYNLFPPNFLNESASAIASSVADLQRAGARTILVPNSFLYTVYAARGGDLDPANASAYSLCVSYNTLRWSNMTAAGVLFIPADLDSMFRYVVHHPTSFGFTADSVLSANAPSPVSAILADNSDITQAQQQTFLFVDGHHLTTAGQTIEADYEYSLLIAPGEISLLAENAVQTGWAHAATIQSQLDVCGRMYGSYGRHVWMSAGAYSLAVNGSPGFAGDDGTPFGGSVGLDYQTAGGFIYGAAFTSGSQVPQLSTGGHFSQTDEAISLYTGYVGGPLWGNAVLTYDLMQDNVNRIIPLGNFVDQNNGYTTGQSLSLALRGGRNFSIGRFTTGPVAGWIFQQVRFEGFTETGVTGMTALSFGSQTRNSAVSQLGWRICMDAGRLRPFVEANWNHECASHGRMMTASLTTVAAPTYSMDAAPIVSDWATTSLGAYYQLSSRAMLRGAASAMYVNPQMTTCGGEFGLDYSF